MKFFYIGLCILAALLTIGIVTVNALSNCAAGTIQLLSQAQTACLAGETGHASDLAEQAYTQWKTQTAFLGSILCHEETDRITQEFAALSAYGQQHSRTEFLAGCSRLIAMVSHLPETETPYLHNIL